MVRCSETQANSPHTRGRGTGDLGRSGAAGRSAGHIAYRVGRTPRHLRRNGRGLEPTMVTLSDDLVLLRRPRPRARRLDDDNGGGRVGGRVGGGGWGGCGGRGGCLGDTPAVIVHRGHGRARDGHTAAAIAAGRGGDERRRRGRVRGERYGGLFVDEGLLEHVEEDTIGNVRPHPSARRVVRPFRCLLLLSVSRPARGERARRAERRAERRAREVELHAASARLAVVQAARRRVAREGRGTLGQAGGGQVSALSVVLALGAVAGEAREC